MTLCEERLYPIVELERIAEMIALICGIVGAVEISYVESRIIGKSDVRVNDSDSLKSRYWRSLTIPERCLFWTGLPLLAAPFVVALAI